MADFYGVTTDYLLARTETKSHSNASLADLCLSDDMIELLMNKRIDTALLCKLATHPDFVKLLADIQNSFCWYFVSRPSYAITSCRKKKNNG